jgi:hypothetical protein
MPDALGWLKLAFAFVRFGDAEAPPLRPPASLPSSRPIQAILI